MSREIKFRALNRANGEWYYGCQNPDESNPCEIELSHFWLRVEEYVLDPETVGQYTGLCDKNGKDVFADDKVRADQEIGIGHYENFDGEVYLDNKSLIWYVSKIRRVPIWQAHNIELIKEKE